MLKEQQRIRWVKENSTDLTLYFAMSKNGWTHFKNLAANKCKERDVSEGNICNGVLFP